MKKKQIAVLLAALLSVSPAVEGVAVMGADFSSRGRSSGSYAGTDRN